ncbi:alpha-amylase family glycosyl hydrolase [Parvularcula dongshanensis]|uniref:Alpha-glucosidase n=1 Tax=Parvularcula dongshanensis TaxID=1173995 RepID=A0A840I418_9PROT|nr:alpha-amylase family glycosyl hydrolase [Parvularcula dongshanensis]MBB4659517.1 alpha-glucosidase [Parvularcula dongshanensis]
MSWWHDEAIYQIYPRSFQDTTKDGVGDLEGIRERLPYLKDLGVGAIWLSPIFPSPMKDFGYDVADYTGIDPLFGDMAAFDRLLTEAHEHGLKLLLDFVPNHSSDQHPWFQEARKDKDNPKRDWYIWRDPGEGGGPPNNWVSNFGGPAWTLDEATGQYYHHAFLSSQPDLNWRNPELRAAMFDALRFWLGKGVDGFRVDVIWHLIKDDQFRDNPENPFVRDGAPEIDRLLQVHSADQPEVHDVIAEMRAVIDEYEDRLLIGEIYLPLERLMAYYGQDGRGVHLPFNFQLISAPWRAESLSKLIDEYEAALPDGGWPNWVLSNHDQPRIAARIGEAQARVAAMLLLTLRGTPTLYYGDEIGIGRVSIPTDRIQDPWAKQEPDASFNRDKARTPMQWDEGPHAGFTKAEPWLPQTDDAATRNVAVQREERGSMLSMTKALLALRRDEGCLRTGDYQRLPAEGPVLAYARGHGSLGVFLNLSDEACETPLPEAYRGGALLLSTVGGAAVSDGPTLALRANEGVVIRRRG